ncbi:hypothetical protein CDD83_9063 [Cordyceps sp. RAO-2017]|nr:hypothetical protein CDD83_9063 [Cordyceps sp. RAO-2017]
MPSRSMARRGLAATSTYAWPPTRPAPCCCCCCCRLRDVGVWGSDMDDAGRPGGVKLLVRRAAAAMRDEDPPPPPACEADDEEQAAPAPASTMCDRSSSEARLRTSTAESVSASARIESMSERTWAPLSVWAPSPPPTPPPASHASVMVRTRRSRLSRTTGFLCPSRWAMPASISGRASDAATDGLSRSSLSSGSSS